MADTGVNSWRSVATEFRSEGDDTDKVDWLQVVLRRSDTTRGDGLEVQRPTRVTLGVDHLFYFSRVR